MSVPDDVVKHAVITTAVGDRAAATKATFSKNKLSWAVGDKIVMVSNGQVNGTLTCTEAGDPATFEGEAAQFTPTGVDFYFLGNHDADGIRSSFDLSKQTGTEDALVGFLFLKTSSPVTLTKVEDGKFGTVYSPSAQIEFGTTPLVPFLHLQNLDKGLVLAGLATEDDLSGIKASGITFTGLANRLDLNLKDGTVSAGVASSRNTVIISPSAAKRANDYWMAVVPQDAKGISMQVNYTSTKWPMLMWSNIDWDIKAGTSYYTQWDKQTGLSFGALSTKGGYNGVSVEGGETADGLNNKGGYNGSTVGDAVDDPQGQKGGYSGVGL